MGSFGFENYTKMQDFALHPQQSGVKIPIGLKGIAFLAW